VERGYERGIIPLSLIGGLTMFRIYIRSDRHARTINTPTNARTYYDVIIADTRKALLRKLKELRAMGKEIIEIRTALGARVWEEEL
jgi:hypothetical protein